MRTFLLIVGGFLVVVALSAFVLLGQNRGVKAYAETVFSAVQRARPRETTDCARFTQARPLRSVQRCTARVEAGRTTVAIRLRNGREVELASGGGQTSYSERSGMGVQ